MFELCCRFERLITVIKPPVQGRWSPGASFSVLLDMTEAACGSKLIKEPVGSLNRPGHRVGACFRREMRVMVRAGRRLSGPCEPARGASARHICAGRAAALAWKGARRQCCAGAHP